MPCIYLLHSRGGPRSSDFDITFFYPIIVTPYLEEDLNKKILDCFSTIIDDQQKIGNMVPACCDQITGAPSDSLVDHIRLHTQEASLARNHLVY